MYTMGTDAQLPHCLKFTFPPRANHWPLMRDEFSHLNAMLEVVGVEMGVGVGVGGITPGYCYISIKTVVPTKSYYVVNQRG